MLKTEASKLGGASTEHFRFDGHVVPPHDDLFGFLNAGTPLLIASTPVSAVQPEENARSSRNTSARLPYSRADLNR